MSTFKIFIPLKRTPYTESEKVTLGNSSKQSQRKIDDRRGKNFGGNSEPAKCISLVRL